MKCNESSIVESSMKAVYRTREMEFTVSDIRTFYICVIVFCYVSNVLMHLFIMLSLNVKLVNLT